MWILDDFIQIQFPIKPQTTHSTYVVKTFNYVVIVALMLFGAETIE
jgi:hypothetical protein